MKIGIIASGSQGDVQPYIALAKGLKTAGYSVMFVSHENYSDIVTRHNIEFCSAPGNVQAIAQSPELSEMLAKGKFLSIMKIMGEEAKKASVCLAKVALSACNEGDLILGGLGGLDIGIAVGEKLDIPVLPAYLLPFTPTKAFPSVLSPSIPGLLQSILNKASHRLARQIMWQSFRKADALARKEILGVNPAPIFGPYNAKPIQNMPILYGFSSYVIPRPNDWPEKVKISGYWFLDSEDDWQPPKKVVDFIEAGPPPIYIGFGSMSNRDPEATAKLIINAVNKSKQRAILQAGWGGLDAKDLPDSILMIKSIPHTWLFSKMAAVVHHGGVGTTASGLRAGIPNIIVPFFADQPFWGQRVEKLGVGPRPIPIKKLSVDNLAFTISQVVSSQEMQLRARKLGDQIRSENGVKVAVEIINEAIQRSEF